MMAQAPPPVHRQRGSRALSYAATQLTLADGRVMIASLVSNVVEIFSPKTNAWSLAAPLPWSYEQRSGLQVEHFCLFDGQGQEQCPIGLAQRLDGRVLLFGIIDPRGQDDVYELWGTRVIAVYDPDENVWETPSELFAAPGHTPATVSPVDADGIADACASGHESRAAAAIVPEADSPPNSPLPRFIAQGFIASSLSPVGDGRIALCGVDLVSDPRAWHSDMKQVPAFMIYDMRSDTWMSARPPSTERVHCGQSTLHDGRVLICGGSSSPTGGGDITSVEIFDPATNQWTPGPSMPSAESTCSQSTLSDGRVVVSGFSSAWIFDPATETWDVVPGRPNPSGYGYSNQSVLPDGRVMFCLRDKDCTVHTWCPQSGRWQSSTDLRRAKQSARWSMAAPMPCQRRGHTISALRDGRALMCGGRPLQSPRLGQAIVDSYNSAEYYNPQTDTWSVAPPLQTGRNSHSQSTLIDGRVLVCGGVPVTHRLSHSTREFLQSTELFDPTTGQWSYAAPMHEARARHGQCTLPDGRVIVCGHVWDPASSSPEIYDPETNRWEKLDGVDGWSKSRSQTALHDGRVLEVTGSFGDCWLFDPDNRKVKRLPACQGVREEMSLCTLHDGTVFLHEVSPPPTGPTSRGIFSSRQQQPEPQPQPPTVCRLFDPKANTWVEEITSPNPVGLSSAACTLKDGRVLLCGTQGCLMYDNTPWAVGLHRYKSTLVRKVVCSTLLSGIAGYTRRQLPWLPQELWFFILNFLRPIDMAHL